MNTTMNSTITFSMPTAHVAAERLSELASALRARLTRAGLAVWRGMEAYGHERALRELRNLHDRWESTDPQLARQTREASRYLLQAAHR